MPRIFTILNFRVSIDSSSRKNDTKTTTKFCLHLGWKKQKLEKTKSKNKRGRISCISSFFHDEKNKNLKKMKSQKLWWIWDHWCLERSRSSNVDSLNSPFSAEAARAYRSEGQGNGNRVSVCLKTRVTVNNFFLLKTFSPAYVHDEFWIQDYRVT